MIMFKLNLQFHATRALGTTISIGTPVMLVGGLTEIGGLSLSADTIDVTTLDSDGGYREFIGGFKDGGEVSVSGFFDNAVGNGQAEMYTAFESGEVKPFVITFPAATNTTWTFNGVVTGFETSAGLEDPISFSGSIKVSGKPTLATTA